MPSVKCKICNSDFYPRPANVRNGWGIYCSLDCKYIGAQIKTQLNCSVCGIPVFKTQTQMKRSKSGKYFCGKSCQTKWRNVEFSGEKHAGWKGGVSTYRDILLGNKKIPECSICQRKDFRILAVHHVDENHANNNRENLAWLCHNCHYLVHHDKVERQKFLTQQLKAS